MKNYRYIVMLIFLGFMTSSNLKIYAQQKVNEGDYILSQENFQLNQNISNLLTTNELNSFASNIQLSDNNYYLNLNQIGNSNKIELKDRNMNDTQIVNQIGNENSYRFINYYNSSVSNFNISQLGNSNNLQIYGKNSIIKDLSIIQKSNFKTIIIKNY